MRPLHFWQSFQFRLLSIITVVIAIATFSITTLFIFSEIADYREHIAEILRLQAQHLAETIRLPLYSVNQPVLQQLVEKAARVPEMRAIVISDMTGKIIAGYRQQVNDNKSDSIHVTVEVHNNPLTSSVETVISGGSESATQMIGTVHLERGMEDLKRMTVKLVLNSVGIAIGLWLAVSLVCYTVLRRVTRSFRSLMNGIHDIKSGDLSSRIDVTAEDEAGMAAHAFNDLAEALQHRNEENSQLQEERLNLERQILHVQKLESLGVMAGGIAHDFNNLLQAILGNMEVVSLKLEAESPLRKYIDSGLSAGKHAARLTGLLLAYTGKGFFSKTELDLNELVRENTDILNRANLATITTESRLLADLPSIFADKGQIQQLVMNLIINATESIDKQPGRITITTGLQIFDQRILSASLLNEKPEPGYFVFLEVADNGCGMDEETISRILDPFFTTKFIGRGLGMSAVMGIINTHSGALFVESTPGKGSTFKVLFPLPKTSALTAVDELVTEDETVPEEPLSGTVLVVDDDKTVLKTSMKMVSLCGFTVITARDGIEAVEKYREHVDEIDIVLMDVTMRNMDGITAMSEIHKIKPDARIILASGFNEESLGDRIINTHPAGFIRKPYSISALQAVFRSVMGENRK